MATAEHIAVRVRANGTRSAGASMRVETIEVPCGHTPDEDSQVSPALLFLGRDGSEGH
jgi:hypothetical protein